MAVVKMSLPVVFIDETFKLIARNDFEKGQVLVNSLGIVLMWAAYFVAIFVFFPF